MFQSYYNNRIDASYRSLLGILHRSSKSPAVLRSGQGRAFSLAALKEKTLPGLLKRVS